MKDAVVVKSYQNGISLKLNAEIPFEQLLQEIACRFTDAKGFFGKAKMALAFEGRKLSEAEEIQILKTIKRCSDVNVVCIVGKNEETEKHFIKALQQVERKLAENSNEGQFYKGSLKKHEIIETENSIIILGDIYPGSSVISSKNIIILGGLYGSAYAGGNGAPGHYVAALEMEPEKLKVGDFKYKPSNRQIKWGTPPKVQPKVAFIKNERIVLEPITKELLGSF